jgi:hypothetical protein
MTSLCMAESNLAGYMIFFRVQGPAPLQILHCKKDHTGSKFTGFQEKRVLLSQNLTTLHNG